MNFDKTDILAHKYKPNYHNKQEVQLKQWIRNFMRPQPNYSDSDSEASEDSSTKCVLLTGPPGVGKTSLVHKVANELNLHVVESHSGEKRDSKLFSQLKLTNQRGKINAFAKLFQAQVQQQQQQSTAKRKKRKLANESPAILCSNGDTSIILFDDIDIFFEEDGPFLKSLAQFIKESKRPVVLTATQSIDHIKSVLPDLELIHLNKPSIDDCAHLLKDICRRENYIELGKISRCRALASKSNCDFRQCLNRIHFYGTQADQFSYQNPNDCRPILPNFTSLNLDSASNDDNEHILNRYTSTALVDIMETRFNINDSFIHILGKQIRESIVELSVNLWPTELKAENSSQRSFKLAVSDNWWLDGERAELGKIGGVTTRKGHLSKLRGDERSLHRFIRCPTEEEQFFG